MAARLRILTSSWVVPVDRPPLARGAVAVQDDRIAWVGEAGDREAPAGVLHHLGPGVLLPGLVNAHCHLELSHLGKGRLGRPRSFVQWVTALVEARESDGPGAARAAAEEAIRQLLATGTVAVGDVSNTLGHLDLLRSSGLAAVVFHELLGWDPAGAAALLDSAEQRTSLLRQGDGPPVKLAAHAPHSVSRGLLEGLVRQGGPAAIHLAESEAESQFLATGGGDWAVFLQRRGLGHVAFEPPGLSPVRYLESLRALGPQLLAAHCIRVDAADRALLAQRGVHVAVCPRSNRSLGLGVPPVPELAREGVRLCLGTDSLASVDSLDLMEDAVALHREFPALDPAFIVRMATAGGAEALGLHDLGTLAPGRRSALAFAPAPSAPADPFSFLLSGEARARPVAA